MKDGPLRRAVKAIARGAFAFDLFVHRALRQSRGERSFLLGGDCRLCARCCEAPAIRSNRLVWYLPTLRRAFLWWQRQVNGFELLGRDVSSWTFVFTCTHFDRETRRCDSYESRPGICRDYPRALLWQPAPEMLPGCGYRPVAKNADQLLDALTRYPLSADQKARLRKGLFLDR